MAEEAVSTIVMSVNGLEYDCVTFNSEKNTGRAPLPTMNREQKVKYKKKGIRLYNLSWSVVIPNGKDTIDWLEVEDARISIESPNGEFRETYVDCDVATCSDAYDVGGETRRDLTGFSLDYIKESI